MSSLKKRPQPITYKKLSEAITHWHYIAPITRHPKNDKEFNQLVVCLDQLLEIVGDDENHKLIGLVEIVGDLVAAYEKKHFGEPKTKGVDALEFLMQAHNLSQADLPEIASQGVMSEILNGKRSLNVRQIKLLAKRFGVTPSTFIDD